MMTIVEYTLVKKRDQDDSQESLEIDKEWDNIKSEAVPAIK